MPAPRKTIHRERTNLTLNPEVKRWAIKRADRHGQSLSEYIEMLIRVDRIRAARGLVSSPKTAPHQRGK